MADQTEASQNVEGTVTVSVGTVVGGTLQNITSGTINAGTAKVDQFPGVNGTAITTYGTTAAAVWGTLVAAAGAGTVQYVQGLSVVVEAGTVDVAVTNIGVDGTTGAGVLVRGNFAQNSGIARSYVPPMASGANGTLGYWLGGAGTVAITVDYWQGV
jgi:hypothetical protein